MPKIEVDANYVAPLPIAEHRDESIERRWDLVWKTAMLMESRLYGDPEERFALYQSRHRSRCIALQHAGIRWRVIVLHSLDNPLHSAELFEFQLHAAKKRSAQRVESTRHNIHKRKPGFKARQRS